MAGDDTQRMDALKRAYADILLNTAKESAARVVASERKAAQLQQSLSMAKDEAVAMLARFKSTMDAKMNEMEKVSTSQEERIKELELQLTEAKVTIDCLRSNLKRVNLELDSRKNRKPEFSDERSTGADNTLVPGADHRPPIVPHAEFEHAGSLKQVEFSKKSIQSDDSTENPDYASMISRNKKAELYRNGYTQRIHAVEHNMLAGREAHVEDYNIKSKNVRRLNRKSEAASKETYDLASKKGGLVKKLSQSDVDRHGSISRNCHATGFFNQHFSRKQRSRRKHSFDHPVFHAFVDAALKYHELSDPDHLKTDSANCANSDSENIQATMGEDSAITVPCTLSQVSRGNNKFGNGENIMLSEGLNQDSSHHTVNRIINSKGGVKQDSAISEDHVSISHADAGKSECDITPEEPAAVIEFNEDNKTVLNDDVNKSAQIDHCSILTALVHKTSEDLDTKENHIDTFKIYTSDGGEPFKSSDPLAEGGGDRIVKYTFQRKRKREPSCSRTMGLQFQENDTLKQNSDKENSLLEPPKPSLFIESSRDSRRLAQVARQLISLSEKRWW